MKSIVLWLTALLLGTSAALSAQTVNITEYAVPSAAGGPAITVGPDGALWFTEANANKIGRITTGGVVTEFQVPTPNSSLEGIIGPEGITAGPDGALWFTEFLGNKVGRITTAGVITEYAIPTANSGPKGITAGPDGALWFTESEGGANFEGAIGRITTAGVVTNEYEIATAQFDNGTQPSGITAGSDGALWFTTNGNETPQIGRITTDGVMTDKTWQAAAGLPGNGIFYYIAAGPDGALWFTENIVNRIGRLTTAGTLTEYDLPSGPINWEPEGIAVGPDGALWFTEVYGGAIGRITTAGVITEYDAPSAGGITAGPDGALWFTAGGAIGRAYVSAPPVISSGGIVPVDSTVATIQPGEWVSIFGTNLASSTAIWSGDFPLSLGGTSVTINGKAAYLSFASPTQINLQAPDDTTTGSVPVVVTTAGGSTTSAVTLAEFAPSFLLLDNKHVAGLILRSNGMGAYGGGSYDIIGPTGSSLGYPTVAAKAGDTVELFAVGLGPTNKTVPAGQAFSGAAATTSPVNVLINNVSVTPAFAGLSGAGLYQINLIVPAGLGTGDVALYASVSGALTPSGVVVSLQ